MTEKSSSRGGARFIVIVAAFVVILWGISQAQSVMLLSLVSVFLAIIGTPPVLWLQRKHIPSVIAVLLVVAGMIALLLIIGVIVGTSINSFSDTLPFYQGRIQEQASALKGMLASRGIEIPDTLLLKYVNPEAVMSVSVGMLAGMGSALSNIVIILLIVSFILLEASSFPFKLRAALGDTHAAFPKITELVDDIKRYVVIQTLISLIAGTLIGVWLYILGVDFPVLWGFVAFLLNYVPNLGAVIAAVPAVLLALVQLGMGHATLAAAGYLTVFFILGNVVQPRLMGRKFGLSPLIVFLSLIYWGSLLGLIGMVLSIPITMILKLALESSESTRWVAVLLGPALSTQRIPSTRGKGKEHSTAANAD
jgi:predicted PurR-regulated permease PerM